MPYVHDLLALFERVAAHSHERTRVVINSYSRAWRPIVRLAEALRLKPRKPIRNWVSPHDVRNLLELAGFEMVTSHSRILLPKRVPLLSTFFNGFLASIWPFSLLSPHVLDRRPAAAEGARRADGVSVVCPCRNEQGHIAQLIERIPDFGAPTELIFVEGDSTDDTRGEIERQIEAHPERDISLLDAAGQGQGRRRARRASTRPSTTC